MRVLTLSLLASCFVLSACSDDGETPAVTDTGSDAAADTTVADTGGEDSAGTCASGVSCVRLADCAGVDNASCTAGCCVAGGGITPDAGGGGEACGEVTFQGECQGDVAVWCDEGTLGEVDCTTFYETGTGTCAWFGDSFGYWCGVSDGDDCLSPAGDVMLCAGGVGVGCVAEGPGGDDFSVTCTQAEFVECDEETFEGATCFGDYYVADCVVNHPLAWDCTSFGGTCGTDGCVDAAEGSACSDIIACAEGLECVEGDDGLSSCVVGETTEPTCEDGEQNGDEEGVDCGGSCPDACEATEPTCEDGEQNGDEEGVDCGGSCPDACEE